MFDIKDAFPKEIFKNMYIINGHELYPIIEDNDPPTLKNFRVILIEIAEKGRRIERISVLTADDFRYYNPKIEDFDFRYADREDYYIDRYEVPSDVRDFLDKVISDRKEQA